MRVRVGRARGRGLGSRNKWEEKGRGDKGSRGGQGEG